jgi:hypothetical protein
MTDTDIDRTERIRHRAYELWEQAGRPHGKAAEYWRRAEEDETDAELLREQDQVIDDARKRERK